MSKKARNKKVNVSNQPDHQQQGEQSVMPQPEQLMNQAEQAGKAESMTTVLQEPVVSAEINNLFPLDKATGLSGFWQNLWAKGFNLYMLFALCFGFYLAFWFLFTDAHFNEEALLFFIRPVKLSLLVLGRYGFDGISLCFEEFDTWYGYGFFFFPAIIYSLGLSGIFLNNLWLLCALLSQMVVMLPFLLFDDRRKQLVFFLLLFSFPLVQISVKSGSLHSWVVFFMLMAIFLRENRRDYSHASTIGFVFFAALACIFKHLGFVLLLIYFLANALQTWALNNSWRRLFGPFVLTLFIAGPFYLFSQPVSYSGLFFGHHGGFGFSDMLILLFGLGFFMFHFQEQIKGVFRQENTCFAGHLKWLLLWILLFMLFDVLMFSSGLFAQKFRFYLFIVAYVALVYHLLPKISADKAVFYFLFFFAYGFSFFLYLFAHHVDFFVFPLLIWLYLFYSEYQGRKMVYLLIGLGILVSNFFPTQYWFAKNELGFLQAFYGRVCASATWSPLNWSKMPINELQRDLDFVIGSHVRFPKDKELYGLSFNMNFQTVQELNPVKHSNQWSPYFNINKLPLADADLLIELQLQARTQLFTDWSEKSTVSILLRGISPELEFVEANMTLDDWLVDHELTSLRFISSKEKASLMSAIGFTYYSWLKTTGLLYKHYYSFEIPIKNPYVTVYLHESLFSEKGEWFSSPESRFLDGFIERLRRKKEARKYFLLSEPYFDMKEPNWLQAYIYLLQASALDPDSSDIQNDLMIATEMLMEQKPHLFPWQISSDEIDEIDEIDEDDINIK